MAADVQAGSTLRQVLAGCARTITTTAAAGAAPSTAVRRQTLPRLTEARPLPVAAALCQAARRLSLLIYALLRTDRE